MQHKPARLSSVRYRLLLQVTQVLILGFGDSYPICPRCDTTIDREYMNFCDRCGQRLSWEDFENAGTVLAPRSKTRNHTPETDDA